MYWIFHIYFMSVYARSISDSLTLRFMQVKILFVLFHFCRLFARLIPKAFPNICTVGTSGNIKPFSTELNLGTLNYQLFQFHRLLNHLSLQFELHCISTPNITQSENSQRKVHLLVNAWNVNIMMISEAFTACLLYTSITNIV